MRHRVLRQLYCIVRARIVLFAFAAIATVLSTIAIADEKRSNDQETVAADQGAIPGPRGRSGRLGRRLLHQLPVVTIEPIESRIDHFGIPRPDCLAKARVE